MSDRFAGRPVLRHLHWGGGTPTILNADDLSAMGEAIARFFTPTPGAEIAIEIDPRTLTPAMIEAIGDAGFTRASLGVQDISPEVQAAVNRIQPVAVTARANAAHSQRLPPP